MRLPGLIPTRTSWNGDSSTDDERELRRLFDRVAPFTVGAEEEYLLVDCTTFEPAPVAEYVLAELEGDPRYAPEFRAAQIEALTAPCATVGMVEAELSSARQTLAASLAGTALRLAGGTHPFALEPCEISPRSRYRRLASAHPWAAQHAFTCGLHVHVALSGADRALAVYNALRSYLPEITALAANAPFYRGEDSGMATVRPKLNECWPRAGVPPAFSSWSELAEFFRWAREGGAFPDESYGWWDLRLRPAHGTIEVRAADVQARPEDSATVAALVQSLVFELASRHDAGEPLPAHPSERIAENAWLAARDGVDGALVELETGARVWTDERLHGLAEQLLPVAVELGCDRELLGIGRLVLEGGGAGRQRRALAEGGPRGLIEELAGYPTGARRVSAFEAQPHQLRSTFAA